MSARVEGLALEVRGGERWPWIDPRAVVWALRKSARYPLRFGPNLPGSFLVINKCNRAARWLAALDLAPRERSELLAYLTRVAP